MFSFALKINRSSPARLIMLGFLAIILLGAFLLMLPCSTADGRGAPFSDAIFTATSAACVTGLITQNTATYWSMFGQAIILLLIQIGGMGVITVAIALVRLSGKKIGLAQRNVVQESLSAPQIGGIIQLLGFIVKVTFSAEALGALLLYPCFFKQFGPIRSLWLSLFHSVSAFCNAGFDLLGVHAPFSSLTEYAVSLPINLIIILLILVGGIGFLTWSDIKNEGFRFRKYKLQTKVVLSVSVALILLPSLYYFFFEFGDFPIKKRLIASVFQAVTPRTAGFNSVDLSAMSDAGKLIMIALMLVGGSPGSTAGGMKMTTLAVLFVTAKAVLQRKEEASLFSRRISTEAIYRAVAVLMMYLFLCIGGGILLSMLDDLPMITALFETASAVGTVGLTLGITPTLSMASKIILIILMFTGRIGGLTLVFATTRKSVEYAKYPQEKIMIG